MEEGKEVGATMKEAFEKIKERLEEEIAWYETHGCDKTLKRGIVGATRKALSIVSEVEAEYGKDINVRSNGWIPCDGRKMPKADERVLCLHDDGFIDCGELVGESWCCDMDEYAIDRTCVVAWHPLPEAYRRENE